MQSSKLGAETGSHRSCSPGPGDAYCGRRCRPTSASRLGSLPARDCPCSVTLLTGTIMGVISKAASLRTASLVVGLSSLRVACAWWSVHQHACINRRPHSWRQEPEATYSPTSGLPRFDSITQWLTQMKTLCASVLLARVCAYSVHCCGALCLSIRCYERLGLRMYSWAPVCQCACAH